ncbi:enoyl-CoA hydratase/isomerase family protein [Alloalcanivorax xenomutans]|uniref:enoyl-CoA hydratase/isomerase family protein n=1 Tax=Alloalcanivorax xenomutans TaxID=1094342 RepID=UPI0009B6076D|nr:enoyl-CoA hydratase-related protein [Alloalcanivorax xenomutans]ARB45979.1 enoyl-CoA hydratase [Alloalcanivorax xenomutans]MCE7522036.1 enoyl-CoA hydratase-related protein [Alloalcanivorax xenomutans]
MSEVLLFEVDSNGVALITLNRPEKRNAFNREMIESWLGALEQCRRDDIQAVVITGAGQQAFCSGGDVGDMGRSERGTWTTKDYLWENIHRVPRAIRELDKPVLCALNGAATGAGLDMALACDLRFAANSARLGETYIKVGLVPGDGGAFFLPRLVGIPKALELLWSGDLIDAEEALRLGIVNRLYAPETLLEETLAFARKLALGPSRATRMIKRLVYQCQDLDLATSLDLVSSHMGLVTRGAEHKEGVQAFLEKRRPDFPGVRD